MSKYQPNTKKLAIRFGDNDFYFTCTAFLHVLLPHNFTHFDACDLTFTKAQVAELFNAMAPSLYMLRQDGFKSKPIRDGYLSIQEKHVYLNEEVDAHIDKCNGWDNSEFFCVDFTEQYIWAV